MHKKNKRIDNVINNLKIHIMFEPLFVAVVAVAAVAVAVAVAAVVAVHFLLLVHFFPSSGEALALH